VGGKPTNVRTDPPKKTKKAAHGGKIYANVVRRPVY